MRQFMDRACWQRLFGPSGQRWLLLGLIVFLVAISLQYGLKASGNAERSNRSAFLRWRDQILRLRGENIYTEYAYPNPPIMALVLEPLARLPPLVGSLSWYYLKVLMAFAALYWVFCLVETSEQPFPPWARDLTVLLSLWPITGDLRHGNVNLFILFCVAGALYAFCSRRDFLGGLALALAIACKITPALFVPYFLWKRAWKTLAGCGAGLVLFFFLLPGAVLGFGRNLELLRSWADQMVTPYVLDGRVTSDHPNQSLPGVVFRLMTHSPSFLDEQGDPIRYENVLVMEPRQAAWLVKGCMLAFAALIVWCCRARLDSRRGPRLFGEFALVAVGMLLFSERTWKHHCVMLVLPFAVLTYSLAACWAGRALRYYLIGSLITVFLLMMSTSTTGIVPWLDVAARQAQVYGAYVWGNLILLAGLVVVLRQFGTASPGGQERGTPRVARDLAA
jgi:alpha-1,2-mannosyltransferase